MQNVILGKLLILSSKKWKRFKQKYPNHYAALDWCVVKELDDNFLLIEQERIDYLLNA